LRATAVALVAAALALSCGAEVPPPSAPTPPRAPRVVRRIEAGDLLPADLDLVVRVDLARMRAELGAAAASELAARALVEGGDGGARDAGSAARDAALAAADVAWIAVRAGAAASGDRVVIAEGRAARAALDPALFERLPSPTAELEVLAPRGEPRRAGVGRVIAIGARALAFVSPVEVPAVERVLRDGPDEGRGDPPAEGVVSFDYRAAPLPPELAERYPSIGGILAGVERVRGLVSVGDRSVRLEADVVAKDAAAADRALRFLRALRDNVEEPEYEELLSRAELERAERTVRVRWPVPAQVVLAWLQPAGG
jgi:hypothetical protein